MKPSRTTLIRLAAAAASLITVAGPVSAASAAGFALSLSVPSTPVVGTPMILKATGTIPLPAPGDFALPYWLSLDALPTTLTSTCPTDRWVGAQFAEQYGSIVVSAELEKPDAAGNFSIPVAVTPSAPGSVLVCAYTDDGAAATLAATSVSLTIQPRQSTSTGSPAAGIPNQVRRGIRSCLALLAPKDAGGCIRSAVRRANGACRRLHSHSRRTGCLRAVGKIARKYS
jgi:hypothetical protein